MTDTNTNPFVEDNDSQTNGTDGDTVPQQKQQQETPASSNDNPFADQLSKIVNDKGEPKYKDINQALEALAHSQNFIETLKSEKADLENKYGELSTEVEKRASVEEIVERLANKRPNENAPKTEDNPKEVGLDENKIVDLVNSVLKQQSEQSLAEQNLSQVSQTLSQTYGDKVKDVVRARAKELGTSAQDLETLAKTKPNLVLSLFQDVKVQNNQSTTSTQNPPRVQEQRNDPPKPSRSLMRGASHKELMEALRASKDYTNKRLGVEN